MRNDTFDRNFKQCTKCRNTKKVEDFYWRSDGWSRTSWCKACQKEHVIKRQEERRAKANAQ